MCQMKSQFDGLCQLIIIRLQSMLLYCNKDNIYIVMLI